MYINQLIQQLPKPLKNKYIITLILFIFWIFLLDDYNILNQNKIQKEVNKLKQQKEFYISETERDSIELLNLKTNPNQQERFAREKFLMRKDNEDIFIIRENNE